MILNIAYKVEVLRFIVCTVPVLGKQNDPTCTPYKIKENYKNSHITSYLNEIQ